MFLPSHLHTGSGSDQKVPAPTSSGSGPATLKQCCGAGVARWCCSANNLNVAHVAMEQIKVTRNKN